MDMQLQLVIMSIVALHVAAIGGGGLVLGIMRLLGHVPATTDGADEQDSIH